MRATVTWTKCWGTINPRQSAATCEIVRSCISAGQIYRCWGRLSLASLLSPLTLSLETVSCFEAVSEQFFVSWSRSLGCCLGLRLGRIKTILKLPPVTSRRRWKGSASLSTLTLKKQSSLLSYSRPAVQSESTSPGADLSKYIDAINHDNWTRRNNRTFTYTKTTEWFTRSMQYCFAFRQRRSVRNACSHVGIITRPHRVKMNDNLLEMLMYLSGNAS